MILNELVPRGLLRTLRRWLDTVLLEDASYRCLADMMAQIRQRALDAFITPDAVLASHANYEVPDANVHPWPTRSAVRADIVLHRDEFPVPTEDRIGSDDAAACRQ